MGRLLSFDYTKPFFYMVTLKRKAGLADFSRVTEAADPPRDRRGRPRYLIADDLTMAFAAAIRGFAAKSPGLWPLETFIVMPDHIHLLFHLKDTGGAVALAAHVEALATELTRIFYTLRPGIGGTPICQTPICNTLMPGRGLAGRAGKERQTPICSTLMPGRGLAGSAGKERQTPICKTLMPGRGLPGSAEQERQTPICNTLMPGRGLPGRAEQEHQSVANQSFSQSFNRGLPSIFEPDWHDWIVMRDGQLAAFTRYIRENPERAWRRRRNRRFFTQVGQVSFAGRTWHAYGNSDILSLPVLTPFRCSRSWARGGADWNSALARASRTGPGGAGVGTFMSPCEKACGNAIYKAGGSIVVLSPEGFAPRWHPPRNKESLCAEGRLMFLSLYEPSAARPDNATLYRRCHEMGDAVVAGLRGEAEL